MATVFSAEWHREETVMIDPTKESTYAAIGKVLLRSLKHSLAKRPPVGEASRDEVARQVRAFLGDGWSVSVNGTVIKATFLGPAPFPVDCPRKRNKSPAGGRRRGSGQ
jgi:hypothetical protein